MSSKENGLRLLWFNLATNVDDSILGFTTSWIRAVAKQVQLIHVITMQAGRIEVPGNVRVYSVGKEKGYSEARRVVEFYRHLFRILREDEIDVCFSHMIPIFTMLAAPLLKAKGIPIVTWYAHRQLTLTLKVAHYFSDQVVSANEESYRYRHDKLMPLGHGIDTALFSPDSSEPIGQPSLLLSVGRLSPIKDPMTLIRAVYLLRQRGYDVRCALVGDAPLRDRLYADQLKYEVIRLGLDGAVQFVGPVPQEEVPVWYRQCFAHVNCAPSDHSLDKAPLEAMACGKPSFSSVLAFRGTMGAWSDRLLFRQGDAADLADKLIWLLELHSEERERMGLYLRRQVVQEHSLERLIGKLVCSFNTLAR